MTLDDFLKASPDSAAAIAKELGVNYSTIWRLRTGKQKPTWSTLEKILKLTNGAVTANDWVTADGDKAAAS